MSLRLGKAVNTNSSWQTQIVFGSDNLPKRNLEIGASFGSLAVLILWCGTAL
jgi:hypothetical protein